MCQSRHLGLLIVVQRCLLLQIALKSRYFVRFPNLDEISFHFFISSSSFASLIVVVRPTQY